MFSISLFMVVHDQPLKSLNTSTLSMFFPVFIRSEIAIVVSPYLLFNIFLLFDLLSIAYNNFSSIG